ncbi:ArsR/SmtB family transcription factor [Pseudomonas sp. CGJS7]|uniref:ArsR/SmtB family transcription factor n=1 Tax=Pseudomonas sp. CGJS7 TaxID=3109348 RepID=UPI003009C365
MRPLHHPATDDIELTSVLYALADPVRLSLVRGLSRDNPVSCVGACLDNELALPRATLSRHFDVLRSAGLVHTVKSGTQYLNTLRCDDLDRRFPGLLRAILLGATGLPAARFGQDKAPAAKPETVAARGESKPAARGRRGQAAPARAGKAR